MQIDDALFENKLSKRFINEFGLMSSNYINVFESYTEIVAGIMNVMLFCIENNKDNLYDLLNIERNWSLFQAAGVLKVSGYEDIEDFLGNKDKLIQKTNVFSYYILRSAHMYSIEKYLEWMEENVDVGFRLKKDASEDYYELSMEAINNKEYKKITQTISHWLASVGGITAIFLSGFQMFFGGMINFIWTVRFLSRDSPPSGYSKTSYKKKMKNLGTDPNDPANKMATKTSTKDGKANLNKNQDNDKRLSFWETFKLYCIRSPLFRWICCCCVGQKRQTDLSDQLSHYQKSRQKLRSQLNLGIFLQKFEGLIKNQNFILKNLHLQSPPRMVNGYKKKTGLKN